MCLQNWKRRFLGWRSVLTNRWWILFLCFSNFCQKFVRDLAFITFFFLYVICDVTILLLGGSRLWDLLLGTWTYCVFYGCHKLTTVLPANGLQARKKHLFAISMRDAIVLLCSTSLVCIRLTPWPAPLAAGVSVIITALTDVERVKIIRCYFSHVHWLLEAEVDSLKLIKRLETRYHLLQSWLVEISTAVFKWEFSKYILEKCFSRLLNLKRSSPFK